MQSLYSSFLIFHFPHREAGKLSKDNSGFSPPFRFSPPFSRAGGRLDENRRDRCPPREFFLFFGSRQEETYGLAVPRHPLLFLLFFGEHSGGYMRWVELRGGLVPFPPFFFTRFFLPFFPPLSCMRQRDDERRPKYGAR